MSLAPEQQDQARLERLATWALGPDVLRENDLPYAVTVVTDTLAAILGAATEDEVRGFAAAAPAIGGAGSATVLATAEATSPAVAAWANGLAAVRLELDEGNQFVANHPAAHVLPAVLAVAETQNTSGRGLLEAFTAGYEVAVRVGRGIRLHTAVHPFGTAMICGAAMGVARVRGRTPGDATQAVLIAAALTPASTQHAATRGATVRNAVTGACASSAIIADALASTGTGADSEVLRTVYGEIPGTSYDGTHLDAGLGEQRYLTRNYLKLHACSRWNHAAVEATVTLQAAHDITLDQIEDVEVATYDPATRLADPAPPNGFAGKHSIPYSVAVRLLYGRNGLAEYTDAIAVDPVVRALAARVRVVEDPAYTRAAPGVRAARVTLRMRDGQSFTAVEDRAPGGFDRPYPAEVLAAKHRELLGRTLPDPTVTGLLGWCAGLPEADSVAGLRDVLRPGHERR